MLIYEPKGKAREYSPLAFNIFNGCDHGCKYCYVPNVSQRRDANTVPLLRKNIVHELEKELNKSVPKSQILLCFLCDPYPLHDQERALTRQVLEIFLRYHCKIAVLSKGGSRALRDLDIMRQFPAGHFKFGMTLTFWNDEKRKELEPKASPVPDRLASLEEIHSAGIKTFVSIEPVIDPIESMKIIGASLPFVDQYKIGKINHDPSLEKSINWTSFLIGSLSILRYYKKEIYVKEDLRQAASVPLHEKEKDMNALNL